MDAEIVAFFNIQLRRLECWWDLKKMASSPMYFPMEGRMSFDRKIPCGVRSITCHSVHIKREKENLKSD